MLTGVFVGVGLIAISLAVMRFDVQWSAAIARVVEDRAVLGRVLKLPYHFFARWGFVIVPVALLAYRDRWRLLIGFGINMAVGAAAVHALKFLVGRARPNQGSGPFDFHVFGDPRLQFDSFPSAHATFAMMLAALLGFYLPRWRPALVVLALMLCVARVTQERHFVSDVIAGGGLGIVIVHLAAFWLGPKYFHPLGRPMGPNLPMPPKPNSHQVSRMCRSGSSGGARDSARDPQ
jgi:membrane-associated phospholipid phosphatase